MQCNMVFDIKMEDFRHKARLVAGGHKPEATTYVTSRETVRIALMITAYNDLEDKLADILNACFQAPVTEKM